MIARPFAAQKTKSFRDDLEYVKRNKSRVPSSKKYNFFSFTTSTLVNINKYKKRIHLYPRRVEDRGLLPYEYLIRRPWRSIWYYSDVNKKNLKEKKKKLLFDYG